MLVLIALLLILFWGIGLFVRIAGGFVHLLLVIALVLILMHFLRGG